MQYDLVCVWNGVIKGSNIIVINYFFSNTLIISLLKIMLTEQKRKREIVNI